MNVGRRDSLLVGLPPDVEVQPIAGALSPLEWTFRANGGARCFALASGSGIVRLEEAETAVTAPCLIWLPSGLTADVRLSAGPRGAMMTATDSALARVVPAGPIAKPLREAMERPLIGVGVTPAAIRSMVQEFDLMAGEAAAGLLGMREAIMNRLCLVLISLWRLGGRENPETQSSPRILMNHFLQLVELHARAQWRVADYASALGVAVGRLNTAVRRATGVSPLELIHRRLIEDAKVMLERSTLQVAEIGDTLGFRDPAYFNRFFTRATGLPPGRFRQRAATHRERPDGSYAAWP